MKVKKISPLWQGGKTPSNNNNAISTNQANAMGSKSKLPSMSVKGDKLKNFFALQKIIFNVMDEEAQKDDFTPLSKRQENTLRLRAAKFAGKNISQEIFNTVLESSDVQSKHPIRDYLKSVQTLTVKEDYVAKLFGLITLKDHSHSGLMLKLFRKWLAQCVIQIMEGDFASELCLVLIGPQGCGKTRFIRSLLPKSVPGRYLRTMSITGRNRSELQDEFEALARSWILFDDEWKGVTRTDDQEHLKALLSEKSPQWRAPYDRKARARRRNAVLCGASNRIEVVNDRTGNRRVIPMEVEKIDHVAASQFDLDLLFAQLMQEYAIKGISCALLTDYEITSLRTLTSQGGYNSTDIIMELLEQYTEAGTSVYSTSDIIKGLNALSKQYIRLNHRNVGSALKQLYDYQDSSKSENGKKLSYKGYGLRWKNHPNRNLGDMDKIYPVFGQDPDTYENSYYDDLIDLEEE